MNLRHIEIILAIEAAGSLRAVAKALGRTQPALTKALRQAEADLGRALTMPTPPECWTCATPGGS
jgi:LysR family transcriptional regulator of abg operon